jgi:hypothetical protein
MAFEFAVLRVHDQRIEAAHADADVPLLLGRELLGKRGFADQRRVGHHADVGPGNAEDVVQVLGRLRIARREETGAAFLKNLLTSTLPQYDHLAVTPTDTTATRLPRSSRLRRNSLAGKLSATSQKSCPPPTMTRSASLTAAFQCGRQRWT